MVQLQGPASSSRLLLPFSADLDKGGGDKFVGGAVTGERASDKPAAAAVLGSLVEEERKKEGTGPSIGDMMGQG